MPESDGTPYYIKDPLIELLAITIFGQDSKQYDREDETWNGVPAEVREHYRGIAHGKIPLIRPEEEDEG